MSASFEPQTIPGDDTAIAETVVLPKHLHARPAGQLAQLATRYQGTTIEILASATGKKANARSVLAVMALGVVTGTAITVTATGPDAGAAIAGAVEILLEPED